VIVDGALDAATLTVRVAGDRPTEARLRVTDDSGAHAEAAVEIGVTLPGDGGP
jgi:hypothetical protein